MNKYLKQKGFTLIEVIITVSIFAVLVFGVSVMLFDIFTNSRQELASMSNIDQAHSVAFKFTNEIRNATTGSDGSYALNLADDNQIIFYSNLGTNSPIKRIRYYVSGNNLYKGVIIPSGSPLSYDLASESISTVVTGLMNGTSPIFYYYDGNYAGEGNSLSQPININQIRFIKINLTLQKQTTNNDTSIFSVSDSATIRSAKDNLGN
jgi:prepilin-type N-terminal cleavage/methylation domain-containing protein